MCQGNARKSGAKAAKRAGSPPEAAAVRARGSARRGRASAKLADAEALRAELLAWFRRERRELPWRASRDPYRVWISEAMLQQTRVDVVVGYYTRFLARFPTLDALAKAPVDDVLAAWSGLGYYRRARTLHAAARAIVEQHGGRFPSTRESVLELPGIGPYTAGAVLSIAFDAPEALVDGNVARVLARLFEIDDEDASAAFQERAWSLARALVPAKGAGEWNQALMELGALVCTPRNARCDECPLAARCRARDHGRVDELPRKRARRASVEVELTGAWIEAHGTLVLERRADGGRMAGLWQLPTIESGVQARIAPVAWPAGARLELGSELLRARHTITHHRIAFVVRRARLASTRLPASWTRHELARVGELALSGMTKKALRALHREESRTPLFPHPPDA